VLAAISVEVAHDWVDYLAAAGGLAGVVGAGAAIVALVFAKGSAADARDSAAAARESLDIMRQSAADARDSAAAARESLDIMRQEAQVAKEERERLADVDITVEARARETSDSGPPRCVILDLSIANNGTRVADVFVCNFTVPDALLVRIAYSDGRDAPADKEPEYGRMVGASESGDLYSDCNIWLFKRGPIMIKGVIVRSLRIDRPPPGAYELEALIQQQDLPESYRNRYWTLTVPETGEGVTVTPTEPEDMPEHGTGLQPEIVLR